MLAHKAGDSRHRPSRLAHQSVMLDEVLTFLKPQPGAIMVDATIGAGGHSRALLERTAPDGKVLGIDLDPAAVQKAKEYLKNFSERVTVVNDAFDHLRHILNEHHFPPLDCLLADLGISSLELRDSTRGFSFQLDGPLDMRFGPPVGHRTAADIVKSATADELRTIIRDYGEERAADRIAQAIVEHRQRQLFTTTRQLADLIFRTIRRRGRIHPATRTFQALRIAVNDELGRLQRFLPQAVDAVKPGGRIAIISFHSLEDRIVKQFFRQQAIDGRVRILTKHPATPSFAEVTTNPRSRSAKLRVVVRI